MKNRMCPSRSYGFTLVEFSVVLVIIGLIVGAVVGGKSLMRAAQLNAVVKEVNTFATAINLFEQQYKALPGDFSQAEATWGTYDLEWDAVDPPLAVSGAYNGNGDGTWGDLNFMSNYLESYQAWRELGLAGILPYTYLGDYTTDATSGGVPLYGNRANTPGINVPASKVTGAGYQLSGNWAAPIYSLYNENFITLGAQFDDNPAAVWMQQGVLIAEETYAVDLKMDDGKADTGVLIALPDDVIGGCVDGVWNAPPPSNYVLTDKTGKCYLNFRYRELLK